MLTLECGCTVKAPVMMPSQVFHNYSRGDYGTESLLVACPVGHGLRAVRKAP